MVKDEQKNLNALWKDRKIYVLYLEKQILGNIRPFYSDTQTSCLFFKQEASLQMLTHSFIWQIMYC